MRTPVTKILWNLEALSDKATDAESKEFIKNAYESADSISKMADQLMAVAEIDQNIVIPKYEIINLSEIITEIFKKTDYLIKRRKVKISYVSPLPITLEADKKLLTTALLELVDGAIKYNKEEGSVVIESKEHEEGILIEVRDIGIGITEEQQPLVFTKFFRGTNYDTSKISGAGLGLFIAHAYVALMKGKVWFKSEAGQGTSFFVILPKVRR